MKLGLFSISYAGLWGQAEIDLCQFIRKAKTLGYDTVMLAGKRPQLSALDANMDQIESFRNALDSADVTCSVVAAYNDFGAKSGAEVPLMEIQILYIESLCRIASKLGAKRGPCLYFLSWRRTQFTGCMATRCRCSPRDR